jgi:hypothetical protein
MQHGYWKVNPDDRLRSQSFYTTFIQGEQLFHIISVSLEGVVPAWRRSCCRRNDGLPDAIAKLSMVMPKHQAANTITK